MYWAHKTIAYIIKNLLELEAKDIAKKDVLLITTQKLIKTKKWPMILEGIVK